MSNWEVFLTNLAFAALGAWVALVLFKIVVVLVLQ